MNQPKNPFILRGWIHLAHNAGDLIHVVPIADLITHYEVNCPCGPERDVEDDGTMYITHKAYDGRDEVLH